jgi:RNA polymerase sigma-70 factor (ECF subfamily)
MDSGALTGRLEADAGAPGGDPMDEQAFQLFYAKVAPGLASYLRRTLGDPADADDVFQEAMCRFLRTPAPTRDADQLRAYLFRIATNLCVDLWRRRKRDRGLFDSGAPAHDPADPAARLEAGADEVQQTLSALTPRDRGLLWLAYVEEAPHREIAAALGLKERSIRVLLFRAKRRLASILRCARSGEERR